MTKLVDLAQAQDALAFQEQLNTRIAEKVEQALEAKSSEVAATFFGGGGVGLEEGNLNTLNHYETKKVMKAAARAGYNPYDSHASFTKHAKPAVKRKAERVGSRIEKFVAKMKAAVKK